MHRGIEGILNDLEEELQDVVSFEDDDYEEYLAECMYWLSMEKVVNESEAKLEWCLYQAFHKGWETGFDKGMLCGRNL